MKPFSKLLNRTKQRTQDAVDSLKTGFKDQLNLNLEIRKSGGRFFYKHYKAKQLDVEMVQRSFTMTKITQKNPISFVYDPKNKKNVKLLPIYDTLPLILIFGIERKLFRGINIHFLNESARFILLQRLYQINDLNDLSDDSKRIHTWDTIKTAANSRWLKVAVKSYLFTHVRSEFINFKLEDSEKLVLLPTPNTIVDNSRA